MVEAKGKYRLFTDADSSTVITYLDKFIAYLENGYDIVIGSRRISGAQIAVPQNWLREISGYLSNVFIRWMAVSKIKDTQSGFKAFSEKAAFRIFSNLTILRWGFEIEILAIAQF